MESSTQELHFINDTLPTNTSVADHEHFCDGEGGIYPSVDLRVAPENVITLFFYNLSERVVILSFFPLLILIGFIGNFAFLLVLIVIKEMRTVTNFYLANLAIADLLFLGTQSYDIFVGYILSPDVKSQAYQTTIGCGLLFTILFMSHFASVGFVFLVSLERYLAICWPMKHRLVVAKGRTMKLIIASWLFGLVFSAALIAPHWFVLGKLCVIWPEENPRYEGLPSIIKTACLPIHEFYSSFPNMAQTIPYTVTLITSIYMYSRIVQVLHARVSNSSLTDSMAGGSSDRQAHIVRNQVARLLIVNGIVFFSCHFPYFFLRFNDAILAFSNDRVGLKFTPSQWWVAFWVNRALGSTNSIINPIIYSFTNARYRQSFKTLFMCRLKSPKNSMYSLSSSSKGEQ